MSRRKAIPGGLVALATVLAALTAAPAAFAATDSHWSGQSTSPNWSNAGNWLDNVPGGSTGNLAFGDLTTCDAGTAPSGAVCYGTANNPLIDNVAGVSANTLTINGGQEYQVAPSDPSTDTVTLTGDGTSANVGLTAAPTNTSCITPGVPCTLSLADWGVPIILGSDQEWDVSGYGNVYLNTISGAHNLKYVTNEGWLYANDVHTYAGTDPNSNTLAIQGSGEFQLDSGGAGHLPAVTVNDNGSQTGASLGVANHTASSGNITLGGTGNYLFVLTDTAPNETMLNVTGNVSLDSSSTVEFDLDGNDTTAGVDSSQLTDTGGTINFGGARVSLWQAPVSGSCTTLSTGKTFTVVRGGTLTGQIKVGNSTISPGQSATETLQSSSGCASASKTTAVVDYTANSITATIAGAPVADTTHAPEITGGTTAGDKLTVASNGTWTAYPAPTYSYQWYSCSGSNCSPISGATSSSYTLTNAEAGKTVKVKVTATNSQGAASEFSNVLGPVIATTSGGGSSLRALIRADLARLGHPHGRHAILLMIRKGYYKTHFRAQVAGTLSDVWTTTVRTGHGRHAHRHTYVIAGATVHVRANHTTTVTIHLTRVGRSLLHRHPFSLLTTAHERYRVSGLGWTSITRKFWL